MVILTKLFKFLELVLSLIFYAIFTSLPPKARPMVKTVTMDLNCYYPLVARELFSNAQIVIDRFHMVQMLTRSFNSLRVQIMKQFKK